jgi:D-serine deaminase-like pyridoxal phosphate-dependent protein
MAPQLVAEQFDAGATGVTVATVRQARILRAFGVSTLLVANQVVDPGEVTWLASDAAEHAESPVSCFVDSVDGVELLARRGAGVPTPVLLEVGHVGGRSGVRTVGEAVQVGTAATRSASVALMGVAAFEGSVRAGAWEQTEAGVRELCERVADVADALTGLGMLPDRPIVSAGGSAYFDVVLSTLGGGRPWRLVLRSGCYLTHDHGQYAEVSPFARGASGPVLRPAIEVWCRVHSRPEPGLVVLGAGRRDVSFDAGLPVALEAFDVAGLPRSVPRGTVERLYDQHAVLAVEPGSDLRVGDQVRLGISHPCGTFDRWRWLPVVHEDRIVDAVRTLF